MKPSFKGVFKITRQTILPNSMLKHSSVGIIPPLNVSVKLK